LEDVPEGVLPGIGGKRFKKPPMEIYTLPPGFGPLEECNVKKVAPMDLQKKICLI